MTDTTHQIPCEDVYAMLTHLAEGVCRSLTGRRAMPADEVRQMVQDCMAGYPEPQDVKKSLDWRSALEEQLKVQTQHYQTVACLASTRERFYMDETLISEGVIKGVKYSMEALQEAEKEASRVEHTITNPRLKG